MFACMAAALVGEVARLQPLLLHHSASDEAHAGRSLSRHMQHERLLRVFLRLVHLRFGDGSGGCCLLPGPVVLVGLLRSCRHFLLSPPLTNLQPRILVLTFLCRHRLLEDRVVEKHQVVGRAARRVRHPLQVLRRRVHLQSQNARHAHLVLQYRGAPHSSAHQVPPALSRALQHLQPYLVLLLHDERLCGLRLFRVVAVHIEEEMTAYALTSRQPSADVPEVIRQLHQLRLLLIVALPGPLQMPQVLLRVAQRQQLLAVLYGAGHLMAAPSPSFMCDMINHFAN